MHPDHSKSAGKNPFPSDHSADANIKVVLDIMSNETRVTMETDESYSLTIKDGARVEIKAQTYFGARHGLETLSQMIAYDEMTNSLFMIKNAQITDKPKYVHRGLLIGMNSIKVSLDIFNMAPLQTHQGTSSQWTFSRTLSMD